MEKQGKHRFFWNVTYNDPGRWQEVYAQSGPRLGWLAGMRATLAGFPVGSPKMVLERVEGLEELQAMHDAVHDRTPINFLRTQHGVVAFTKVRLEVYAIPMRTTEWEIDSPVDRDGRTVLHVGFQRDGRKIRLTMSGSTAQTSAMHRWLQRVDGTPLG